MHPIAPRNTCKSAKLRCAELIAGAAHRLIPPSQGRHRTSALVMAVAFPHHAVQEKSAPDALSVRRARCVQSKETGNAVAESENIVAETAERIFLDLADAQTINRDKKGGWKPPLWQALSEAGRA